jgi:DNA polymerase-3 subunit gamma/tau
MANESLIIKHRPSTWKEVIGQNDVVKSFRAALEDGMAHSFLFTGPSGCGKTTLARLGAKELGAKPSDIVEADAATYSGIDDVKALTETVGFRPLGGKIKPFVLDEVHALSRQSWQTLLKKVEEPPEWVYWFFCTTEIAKVPDTIKTRCITYTLKPVSVNDLYDYLERVVEKEGLDTPDTILELCSKEAKGSPRQALSFLSACYSAKTREEAASLILQELSSSQGGAYRLAKALFDGKKWKDIQPILSELKEENPESIRRVVQQYFITVLLNSKDDEVVCKALQVLDHFAYSWNQSDGLAPVIVAVGRCSYG